MYRVDIEKKTLENKSFRKILYTDKNLQLVVMSLNPFSEIGEERHNGTQFIRIESGNGSAIVDGKRYILKDGVSVTIPTGSLHNIKSGENGLQLYTIYSPPQH